MGLVSGRWTRPIGKLENLTSYFGDGALTIFHADARKIEIGYLLGDAGGNGEEKCPCAAGFTFDEAFLNGFVRHL